MQHPPPIRGTFPEALIAVTSMIGFIYLMANNTINTWSDIWLYVGALGVMIVFYFLLILVRAILHFMTNENHFWWEQYQDPKYGENAAKETKRKSR